MHRFAELHFIEWRLSNADMSTVNEWSEISIKQCQKQSSNMRSVHVGIGRDDDFVIAELGDVKRVADRRAKCDHQVFDLLGIKHFVEPRSFNI